MRWTIAMGLGLVMIGQAQVWASAPSEQVLTEMGLSGMQILSDDAALGIRGHGFESKKTTAPSTSKADWYRQAKLNYFESKAKFKESIHPTPAPAKPDKPKGKHGGKHHGGKFRHGGKKL